jgi:WD40 repeat protein
MDSGYSSCEVPDSDELELSWVNGYRGFDSRNNVRYGCGGQAIIYFTASLGIVLFKSPPTQIYFKGHTDDIISMAIYEDQEQGVTHVVTGQIGKGNTYVWSVAARGGGGGGSISLDSTFQTGQKSINVLEFSRDGRLVISIAEDNTVAVTEWKNQRVIANVTGEPAPTYHICPGDSGLSKLFLCCGEKFIRVWSLSGRNLASVKIATSGKGKPQKFWCAAYFKEHWFVGCEDGAIYSFPLDATKVSHVLGTGAAGSEAKGGSKGKKKAAAAPSAASTTAAAVTSFCLSADGELLLSGSRDGTIAIYDGTRAQLNGSPISIKAIFSQVQFLSPQIQSLCIRPAAGGGSGLTLLVGTRGCDILEMTAAGGDWNFVQEAKSPLVQSHCNDELWGLAVHPSLPYYVTVGDDKTLRHWRLHPKAGAVNRMISCTPLKVMARACAFHPEGKVLAVGFGGRVGRGKQKDDGMLRLYRYPHGNEDSSEPFHKLFEIKDAKQWISDVKFSPDGTVLAVGSHDNIVFFYSVTLSQNGDKASLKLTGKFSKHNSYITHLDFSSDGRYLQSNCGAYELLFCDTSTKKQVTSATELRDVRWSTWTCTLGWPAQGIWPAGADGTDVNAVDRSHSGHLLATSDDFGKVKVFRYPCTTEGADALSLSGHSSHVMNVRWTVGDECLLSCGGNDKSIFQWQHTTVGVDSSAASRRGAMDDMGQQSSTLSTTLGEEEDGDTGMGEASGGDEFMAVKPWKGAIRAPELLPTINPSAPSTKLSLHWVHGYTSGSAGAHDSRISSNLFYNNNGEVIYPAAALGVCLHHHDHEDPAKKSQKYFQGHNDDILCLTLSRCKRYVATGQTASKTSKGKGSICIWDAVDCRKLTEMLSCHARGVISLSFNPQGDKLLSIGLDNSYQHTVWSDTGGTWSRVQQLVSEKSDQKTHLYSRWTPAPYDNVQLTATQPEYQFVSGGATSIHFWKIEGSSLSKKESRTGKYKQKPLLCAASLLMKDDHYRLISGTSSGDLYVFDYDSRECKNAIEGAHEGAILTLAEGADHQFLISGGMDKCVKIWNQALQPITFHRLEQSPLLSPVNASIASVDYRLNGDNIVVLVGTIGGEILEIAAQSEQGPKAGRGMGSGTAGTSGPAINFDLMNSTVTVLLQSHYSGELWGLAPHPERNEIVATVSDDGTIRIWDLSSLMMISCTVVGKPMRCVSWNSAGDLLAVGFYDTGKKATPPAKGKKGKGKSSGSSKGESKSGASQLGACAVYRYNSSSHELNFLATGCPSNSWIAEIKFSPLDRCLAVASHDKKLYVYAVPDSLGAGAGAGAEAEGWKISFKKPKFILNKHSSAILHIDFTADEKYFQTNCQAYELLFGDLATGAQKTSATELSVYHGAVPEEEPEKQWASWTCTLGWPVQGIWQEGVDGSEINAVHRSPQNNLLATAEDSGDVKLYRSESPRDPLSHHHPPPPM